jgi:hypothetical protein
MFLSHGKPKRATKRPKSTASKPAFVGKAEVDRKLPRFAVRLLPVPGL